MYTSTIKLSRALPEHSCSTTSPTSIETSRLIAAPRVQINKRILLQQQARPFLQPDNTPPIIKREFECPPVGSLADNPFSLLPPWKKQLLAIERSSVSRRTLNSTQIQHLPIESSPPKDPLVVDYLNSFVKDSKFRLPVPPESSSNSRRCLRARRRLIFTPNKHVAFEGTPAQGEGSNESSKIKPM